VFIEAKDDGGGGDNWTTGATIRAKLQSNHHHQQTNIQFFTGQMPFLSPNQQEGHPAYTVDIHNAILFVCLFACCLMALSAQICYIMP